MHVPDGITITDKTCMDCGGEVQVFLVPDNVWDGLGLPLDVWICLDCFAKRLRPKKPPKNLAEIRREIIRQRERFKLTEDFNLLDGDKFVPLENCFRVAIAGSPSMERVAAGDGFLKCKRKKPEFFLKKPNTQLPETDAKFLFKDDDDILLGPRDDDA